MGTLFLVATPIGNLEDITLRALRILGEVKLIAAEDTRHTKGLLNHFKISTPMTSYFEHNKLQKLDLILNTLESGDVALVSDAGTPTINDPGFELVKATLDSGYQVSPVPGPSSPIAALSASGLPTHGFVYLGYMPRKNTERKKLLGKFQSIPYTLVFLESPNRIIQSLQVISAEMPNRQLTVAREITKKFEEFARGRAAELLEKFAETPKGEIVLLIEGADDKNGPEQQVVDLDAMIIKALEDNSPLKEMSSKLAADTGLEKKKIYQRALELKERKKK